MEWDSESTTVSRGGRNRIHLCLEREGWAEVTIGVLEKGNRRLEESRKFYPSSIFHWMLRQCSIKESETTSWGERRLADTVVCECDPRRARSWECNCGRE